MNFSIIIPCYNAAHTLARAIDSLLVQRAYLSNIILMDDGSTDDTAQIAQDYQLRYPNLIEYHHQSNQGPAKARNQGVAYAKGDYILFLDADDALTPNCLQAFCLAFIDFPSVDIMIAGYTSVHGDRERSKYPTDFHTNALLLQALWFGKFGSCGGAIALRKHCCQYAHYPETIKHGEDVVFFSHLIAKFPAHTLPFIALKVFHSPNSLRHDKISTLEEAEAIIPLLFNPHYLSEEFMQLKAQYHAKQLLSLSRTAIRLKRYALARCFLAKAYGLHSASMYHIKPLKSLIIAYTHRN
jgi:glycosyltransferase involved in cell wall biosynthesis